MIREALAAFLVITLLICAIAVSVGELFWTAHERDCHEANEWILTNGMHGPLRAC